MIALNDAVPEAAATDPAAGPAAAAPPPAAPAPVGAAAPAAEAALAFPSETLPAANQASGSATGLVIVPNVVGSTENEARNILKGVGLAAGPVKFVKLESPHEIPRPTLIAPAYAHDPIVIEQDPGAGESVESQTSVALTMSNPTEDVPEPPSLLLYFAALLIVGFFLWRRSSRTDKAA